MLIVGVGFVSSMMQSCYYDNAEDLYPKDTVFIEDTTSSFRWADDVQPLFEANCANAACHGAGNSNGRIPLSTHSEVVVGIEQHDLRNRIETGNMPPIGELDQSEIDVIFGWIDEGYKNN